MVRQRQVQTWAEGGLGEAWGSKKLEVQVKKGKEGKDCYVEGEVILPQVTPKYQF